MNHNIIVDSGVLMSIIKKSDSNHSKGKKIVNWIEKKNKNYKIVISNLILAEFSNFIQKKSRHNSRKLIKEIIENPNIEIIFDKEEYFEETLKIYNKYDLFGYVDANIALLYINLECEYLLSFDSDFDSIKEVNRIDYPPVF